jgi:hypothetical protein
MNSAGAFHPRIHYEVAGKGYEIGGMGNLGNKIGDAVPVTYPRDQPQDGIIDRPLERVVFVSIWGGVGSIFVIVGVTLLRSGRSRRSRKAGPATLLSESEENVP